MRRALLLQLPAALVLGGALAGQSGAPKPAKAPAILLGIVADTGKKPIADVEIIAIRRGITTLSDSRGIFILPGLEPGEEVFRVRRIGYRAETFDATLLSGDTLRIGVILGPAPFNLPELVVEAEGRMYFGKMMDFADRMLHSGAPRRSFVTQADIDHIRPNKTIDLLVHTGLTPRYNTRGQEYVTCPRGQTFSGAPVLSVYLDGILVNDFDFRMIDPLQIQGIEVYKSAAERPSQYSATGSECTVVIWTK